MASVNDMKAAEATYSGFLTLLKVISVVAALGTAFVVAMIAS